uniref:Uncharacterized protein n=1 Tax=Physcomitrium patens TaxID=3218 RepID=A0A2K1L073_PHYPA|nr:hypothetical protein PHYPA_002212 [Physcomitrium patens]
MAQVLLCDSHGVVHCTLGLPPKFGDVGSRLSLLICVEFTIPLDVAMASLNGDSKPLILGDANNLMSSGTFMPG